MQAGPQVVMERVDSAGHDPIGFVDFELAWTAQRFVTVGCARKRLILADAALPLGSALSLALLFPLQTFFDGYVQRERRVAGSAVGCLFQSAALQNLYFGPLQDRLVPVGFVLTGERGEVEQVELSVVAPAMDALPAPAVPARISRFSRLLLPAVPYGIPTARIRGRSVAPGLVEPARI